MNFKNKVALVTGAASGIGKASAIAFAKEGSKVVLVDMSIDRLENVKQEVNKYSESIEIACDVSDESQVQAMIESVSRNFGKLHFAYNNAGVGGDFAKVESYPTEDWDFVMKVNVRGVFLGMKYQIPLIRESGGGCIVNCASLLSTVTYENDSAYVASKYAVLGLTKNAAVEYADSGIRINAVSPGFTDTPMVNKGDMEKLEKLSRLHPIGRLARPEEIANAVLYLCSDKSSFMVGHNLIVDGGYTIV